MQVSTLFTSHKTATVCAFLWIFGTGLLGKLLLEQLYGEAYWWDTLVELVPAFALHRGLYEIAQYAFKGSYTGTKGLTWAKLGDSGNGTRLCIGWMISCVM